MRGRVRNGPQSPWANFSGDRILVSRLRTSKNAEGRAVAGQSPLQGAYCAQPHSGAFQRIPENPPGFTFLNAVFAVVR